ncbi:MAG: Pr6Pr family membrane protein [Sphingomicrobium sp.]
MRTRGIAEVAALIGWAALALQLALIVRNLGPALGVWRFVGFFTILTNIGASVVAMAMALDSHGPLARARARLMAATSIALVGITYSVALRALWHPTGLQKVADMALHDAMPLLFLAVWVVAPHPGLKWREIGWALLPPAAYLAYSLARGAIDGWYAYWFLNPAEQSAGALLVSVAVMLAGFAAVAALLVAADRWLASKADEARAASRP